MDTGSSVLLFDGVCNLCNSSVQFVLDHEQDDSLRFASLQSEAGHAILGQHQIATEAVPSSLILIEDGRAYRESDAALKLAAHLRAPYSWLRFYRWIPRFVRDPIYRWVARNRYRWFGKSETCMVPTPDLKKRFL